MSLIDRIYAPTWAGGWTATRWLYAAVGLFTILPRAAGIGDVYGVEDMLFSNPPLYMADLVVLTEPTAWGVWAAAVVGLLMLAWGGRAARPGLVLWLLASWVLLANEALNVKAYDRLLTWMGIGLLLGPIGERDLANKARSPFARYFLILVYMALYGSTGWLKATKEFHGWLDGSILSYHLVHWFFGLKWIGAEISDKIWITAPASWFTVVFEASFPLLVWFKRTNPWLLAAGITMHLGILILMHVGPFSFVAIAAYPVLLHPDVARAWHGRIWGTGGAGDALVPSPER